MRNVLFRLAIMFSLCQTSLGKAGEFGTIVSQQFPHTKGVEIICWVTPVDGEGFVSQIIVFRVERMGPATVLWQSSLDPAYSPQIRFVEEITIDGVPVALVERQNGAGTSQLNIVGSPSGRFQRLAQLEGFKFDVEHLDGAKLPFVIAHTDGNILDIPVIYKWNGTRFVDDSASHPAYYQQLLHQDKTTIPPDSSGYALVNLSRIAVLAGNQAEARSILDGALSKERDKGSKADKETLMCITKALKDLGAESRQY